MATRNFFDHSNPESMDSFDRMKQDNITFSTAAENIAADQQSAIFAHESWMNSIEHRNNILGDLERLGVGIAFGGSYGIYYTQNFISP